MNFLFRFLGLTFLLSAVSIHLHSQDRYPDSLKNLIRSEKEDTLKLRHLQALAEWNVEFNPDTTILLCNEALAIYKNNPESKWTAARVYSSMGRAYLNTERNDKALEATLQGLRIREDINDTAMIGGVYINIGLCYAEQGDSANALKYYLRGLNNSLATSNKRIELNAYGNLGVLYSNNLDSAEKYTTKAYLMSVELKFKGAESYTLSDLGVISYKRNNYEEAKDYILRSQILMKERNDRYGEMNNLGFLADMYMVDSSLTPPIGETLSGFYLAEKYYKQCFDFYSGENDSFFISSAYYNLSELYRLSAVPLHDSLNQHLLSEKEMVEYELYYFRQFVETNEKLNKDQMAIDFSRTALNYENEKKEIIAQLEQDRKDARQSMIRNALICGVTILLLFSIVFLVQRNRIRKGKERSDDLLLNILPGEVAEELKEHGSSVSKQIDAVSVLFTDFKGFTTIAEKLTPQEVVNDLNECFSAFDHIMERNRMEKIKTIGDAYMAAGGLPIPNETNAKDAVKAALEIQKFMNEHKAGKLAKGLPFLEIRIGIHTGPVVAGIVGVRKFSYDIWGDTVNIASRMESSGEVGQINISESTYELVKDEFNCTPRGKIAAKGKGEIEMYFVSSPVSV